MKPFVVFLCYRPPRDVPYRELDNKVGVGRVARTFVTRKDRKSLVITDDYPLTLIKPNGLFLKIKKDKKNGDRKMSRYYSVLVITVVIINGLNCMYISGQWTGQGKLGIVCYR